MLREQTAFGQSLAYQPVAQDSLAYGSALPAYEQRQLPDYYSAALAQRAAGTAGTAGTAGNGRAAQANPAGEAIVPVAHFAGGPLCVAQGDWLAAAQPAAMVVNGHALAQAEGLHEATLPDLLAAGTVAGNWVPLQADPQPDHGCQTGGPCACGGACGGKCGGKCGSKGATSAGGCGCGKKGGAAHGVSAGNPWPLDDPRHNLVLLGQELLLLEGHLADPERRCPSCVTKHALTVRALADEGRRLDVKQSLGAVWQRASEVALSGELQRIRAVRQTLIGLFAGRDKAFLAGGALVRSTRETKYGPKEFRQLIGEIEEILAYLPPVAFGPEMQMQESTVRYFAGSSGVLGMSLPGALPSLPWSEILDWLRKLKCKVACGDQQCGSVGECVCGTCGNGSCVMGKCCEKYECCPGNCKVKSGLTIDQKIGQEGKTWGCDPVIGRCICADFANDDCLGAKGCSCPKFTHCEQRCVIHRTGKAPDDFQCAEATYLSLKKDESWYQKHQDPGWYIDTYGICKPNQTDVCPACG